MEVGGQRHAPAALPSGKSQYPLDEPQGSSGSVKKFRTHRDYTKYVTLQITYI